jgi:hypothetical protein
MVNEKFICEFCHAKLSTFKSLEAHKQSAKYCLEKRGVDKINCDFCSYTAGRISNMKRHVLKCKENPNNSQHSTFIDLESKIELMSSKCAKRKNKIIKLKRENEIIRVELTALKIENAMMHSVQKELVEYKKIVSDMRELIAESSYDKGRLTELEKIANRSTTNSTTNTNCITNNYIHSGLAQLTTEHISPFTVELVQQSIDNGGYTEDLFRKGSEGLAIFFRKLMITESQSSGEIIRELNYPCTDTSRNSFHRLNSDLDWDPNPQGLFLKKLYPLFRNVALEYYNKVIQECSDEQNQDLFKYYEGRCLDMVSGMNPSSEKAMNKLHLEIMKLIKADMYVPKITAD